VLHSPLTETALVDRHAPAAQIVALDARRRDRGEGDPQPGPGAAALIRLAPREREVATIIYTHGMLTANEARAYLLKPLSNSAIRSMLTRLEAKGILRKRKAGNKFLFGPVMPGRQLRDRALRRLCDDYFGGSLMDAAVALFALAEAAESEGASAC
jgi:predicted transcriptional regulator